MSTDCGKLRCRLLLLPYRSRCGQIFKTWCEEKYKIFFLSRVGRMIRERGFEVGTKKGRIYERLALNDGLNMRVKNSLDEETF